MSESIKDSSAKARAFNIRELENSPVALIKNAITRLSSRGRGGQDSVRVLLTAAVDGTAVDKGGRFDDLYTSGLIDNQGRVTNPYVKALVPLAIGANGELKADFDQKAADFMADNDRKMISQQSN